ncbi:MAG: hypothetical protein HYZ48_03560, partial [Chlamydiales bacterium]|nr:hypothetical protein [Chlamydiales bacterium]
MKITIGQKLRPFSHRLGTKTLIPFTDSLVAIYPTRVVLQRIADPAASVAIDWEIEGPMRSFTVELDLEKGGIWVFGSTPKGYIRYRIRHHAEGICFFLERSPYPILYSIGKDSRSWKEKEEWISPVPKGEDLLLFPSERLSLGSHKAQDAEAIFSRFDLKEILPILLRLGSFFHPEKKEAEGGTFQMLKALEKSFLSGNRLEAYQACKQWILSSFHQMFVPMAEDPLFQGIVPPLLKAKGDPLVHLTLGAELIRSCFFKEEEGVWEILGLLFPDFEAGRFIDCSTRSQDLLSIEWSKHRLKKMVIKAQKGRLQKIRFPKEIRRFRLKRSLKERG